MRLKMFSNMQHQINTLVCVAARYVFSFQIQNRKHKRKCDMCEAERIYSSQSENEM